MTPKKNIIIIFEDKDQSFAQTLRDYLAGAIEGRVFQIRNARYNCNPRMYRHVVRVGAAEVKEDPEAINIIHIKPRSFEKVRAECPLSDLRFKQYVDKEAKEYIDYLKKRIS